MFGLVGTSYFRQVAVDRILFFPYRVRTCNACMQKGTGMGYNCMFKRARLKDYSEKRLTINPWIDRDSCLKGQKVGDGVKPEKRYNCRTK